MTRILWSMVWKWMAIVFPVCALVAYLGASRLMAILVGFFTGMVVFAVIAIREKWQAWRQQRMGR